MATPNLYEPPIEYRALAEVLLGHPHVLVMTDDICEHIRFDGQRTPHFLQAAPELRERTLVVNGVSKTCAMTGWRIGDVAGPRDLVQAIDILLSQSTGNCCSISQAAAAAELRERELPVDARGVTHRCPYRDGPGETNVPICVGGMVVNPGDSVIGDQDGLLAIPQDGVLQLIEKARPHLETEAQTIAAMKAGRWGRSFIDALEARCNN